MSWDVYLESKIKYAFERNNCCRVLSSKEEHSIDLSLFPDLETVFTITWGLYYRILKHSSYDAVRDDNLMNFLVLHMNEECSIGAD
jgi:hypothetical protein